MQLSNGPWAYNRFTAFEQSLQEGAKPDFLDMDKDGDKEEPMKKAIKEKGSKKETCEDCKKAGKKDCDCHDEEKGVKEQYQLPGGSGRLSDYMQGMSSATRNTGGRGKTKPGQVKSVKEGNCYQEGGKVKGYQKGGKVDKKEVKEALINSIMGDGLANNPVSAEIIVEHMSDEWVEAILADLD